MKIVHLVAGAGEMYCGSCLHGNTLATAIRNAGEDLLLVPVYTPLHSDEEEDVGTASVVFGGINVYLQQQSALFRRAPGFLDWLLDRPALLRWLGRRGWSTRPERLGPLTVSVLQGEEGRQCKELEKLLRWLRREIRPDLVHLSNALLVGMARRLRSKLNVPVVCTLSGEDVFLEKLPRPEYDQARAELRRRCAELTAMVAMSRYYADFMAEYLDVPRRMIHVIPPGLNLHGHAAEKGTGSRFQENRGASGRPPHYTIGCLSRVCPEKGLHLLAEAFILLAKKKNLPPLRLRAAGYLDPADRPYLKQIRTRLAQRGLAERFEYVGQLDRAAKIAFLQSLDVMSVPTVCRESKGLSVLEAWANAVPVVLPNHGAFTELVEDTGGGLLCEPKSPPALAAALKQMICDPALAARCGPQAEQAVRSRYNAPLMARRTIELYRSLGGSLSD